MKEFDEWLDKYLKIYGYNKSFLPIVDMRTSWEAAKEYYKLQWAIEESKADIEAGRFTEESPKEHVKRILEDLL